MHKKIIQLLALLIAISLSGCATAPLKENLPTYSINGINYVPLVALCEQKGIGWDYDTVTQTVKLSNGLHTVSLRVGDMLAMVDGQAKYLPNPVQVYQGALVVPYKFKEATLDTLFKQMRPSQKISLAASGLRKIVLDAGHGGNDPGTIGRTGLREKDVNLDITKRLAKLLREEGVEVITTRSNDRFIPLQRRVDIANNSGADLFVSIHSNANRVRSLNGFEIYYISSNSSIDPRRAMSAARSSGLNLNHNECLLNPSLDLKATLWDMIYTSNRAEAIELSHSICRSMEQEMNTRVLGVKSANFFVLKGAHMPAILIEIGFLSNPIEERKIKNTYYRQQIAEAIQQGIQNYAKEYVLARTN